MPRKKRRFSREFKARVALEAFKEQQTLVQLAAKHEVHPNQITKWKREARLALPEVFGTVKAISASASWY
jgi:transposase